MKTTPKYWHVYAVELELWIGAKLEEQRPCLAIQPSEGEQHLKISLIYNRDLKN